tara:strand:- start:173 stop:478 length:306 start_codon:yes stop_codon:yes gene_type:complete
MNSKEFSKSLVEEIGYRFVVPLALLVSLVGVFVSIANDANLAREIECEKNPRTVWDAKHDVCLPRAKANAPHNGPTPPLDTPNPINYGKPFNLYKAPHGTP